MAESSPNSASDAFLDSITSLISNEDLQGILEAQIHMLGRYEKTNEMLLNFNNLSSQRYEKVSQQFKEHTQLLLDMKMDLDSIFRRIRNLKLKLSRDYPQAYAAAVTDVVPPDLGEDEEDALTSDQPSINPTHKLSSDKGSKISTLETIQHQHVQLKSVPNISKDHQDSDVKLDSVTKPSESYARNDSQDSEYTEEKLLQEVLSFDGGRKLSAPKDDSQD